MADATSAVDPSTRNLRTLLRAADAYKHGLANTYTSAVNPTDLPDGVREKYLGLMKRLEQREIDWDSFISEGVTYFSDCVLQHIRTKMMARGVADKDGDGRERGIALARR